ncbi:hypothetical protein [Amycolatopsis panacis]|uniref:Uncharacterized protein n=1 Tax=Amycolatopsis panacis TaxID=2340917 RepID=A0A419I6B6_9PSEU|nr:hypothetical protein [Amycolatopsis panacis]RJQ86812.1 hypothetical protein D5S19_10815 [Amycolatopsis panacis]
MTAAARPAPRHRSILGLLLTALLLLAVAAPGPVPEGPRPAGSGPALVQQQAHSAVAHPLPLADVPGESRLSRPAEVSYALVLRSPAEASRAYVPAVARAPPGC